MSTPPSPSNLSPLFSSQKIRDHKDLIVWQKAMDLAEKTYKLGRELPATERYGMWSQMTRAALSIPSNIAEGHARSSRKDYASFLAVSRGSLMELETILLLGERIGYFKEGKASVLLNLIHEVNAMLLGLRAKLLAPKDGNS